MAFINSFFTYLVMMILFAGVAGVGVFLGIVFRKRSDAKAETVQESED